MSFEWAVGVMAAKRPMNTWREVAWNLQKCGWRPIVFAEFDVPDEIPYGNIRTEVIRRPVCADPQFPKENIGPDGRMGNFQNFVQTLADLLWMKPTADVIMVVEDDVIMNLHAKEFVEARLWPSVRCGMVSLYCPDFKPYRRQQRGLFQVDRANWMCGQALAFPRHVVIRALQSPLIQSWRGSHRQRVGPPVPPWERKASDAWIGNVLTEMQMPGWCFCPSLAKHYAPPLMNGMNSAYTMGHGKNIGPRAAYEFIGENANPNNIFPRVKERMEIDKLKEWDEWHGSVREGSK